MYMDYENMSEEELSEFWDAIDDYVLELKIAIDHLEEYSEHIYLTPTEEEIRKRAIVSLKKKLKKINKAITPKQVQKHVNLEELFHQYHTRMGVMRGD